MVREESFTQMGRDDTEKGGWAAMSICASLASAAMLGRGEGLPGRGVHNRMIDDVFVSWKRCPVPESFNSCVKIP